MEMERRVGLFFHSDFVINRYLSRAEITKHAFRKETMMFSRELITRIGEDLDVILI